MLKSLLDPSFKYTPAKEHEGDPTYLLRKFRRMQREAKENAAEAAVKVEPIKRKVAR